MSRHYLGFLRPYQPHIPPTIVQNVAAAPVEAVLSSVGGAACQEKEGCQDHQAKYECAVSQLEQGGYVKKMPDPYDRRVWILVLTAKGKKVKATGQQINYEFEDRWKKKLGEKDYQQFRQLLEKLCS